MAEPLSTTASKSYFVKHWRGDLPLPVSYWVNGVLLGIVVGMIAVFLNVAFSSLELRRAAFLSLGVIGVSGALTVWSLVGVMRSAIRHPQRGGSRGWAITAQIVTVLGAINFINTALNQYIPQIRELISIALDRDSVGRIEATITLNGRGLLLRGSLGTGSYERIRQLISAAPGVRTLILDSNGGRLREAEQLAAFVEGKGLDTYVEGQCVSACTYILMAGRDRAATPNSKIGFHRPSLPGANADFGWEEMLSYYQRAGISETFLRRVQETSFEDMWYPSQEELISNGVLNRISMGGEAGVLSSTLQTREDLERAFRALPLMEAMEERFPGTLDLAIDAAWVAAQKGENDSVVLSSSRDVFSAVYPKLLQTADDVGLNSFLELLVHQLSAARDLGAQACGLFLDGQLDVSKSLPQRLVEEEMAWGIRQLETAPLIRPSVDDEEFFEAFSTLGLSLDDSTVEVVAAPENFIDQPALRCDAMMQFYEEIAALPYDERTTVLRGLFQSDEQ